MQRFTVLTLLDVISHGALDSMLIAEPAHVHAALHRLMGTNTNAETMRRVWGVRIFPVVPLHPNADINRDGNGDKAGDEHCDDPCRVLLSLSDATLFRSVPRELDIVHRGAFRVLCPANCAVDVNSVPSTDATNSGGWREADHGDVSDIRLLQVQFLDSVCDRCKPLVNAFQYVLVFWRLFFSYFRYSPV